MERVDIIVLGATGFTGKFVVKILAELSKESKSDISWGVSGRSRDKLHSLLMELDAEGLQTSNIPIVECDIKNLESLQKVTGSSRLLINCTGPNTLLSGPVVEACIGSMTHYLDISAELFHILGLYKNYHKAAEEANVLVIPTCGFSALPAEIGVIHIERNFKGILNTVECYVKLDVPKRAYIPGRSLVHCGTWESMVHVLDDMKKYQQMKRETFPAPVEPVPEELNRSFFHRHKGKFWFPYPGAENDVAEMSQRYLYEKKQKKPVHFKAYTAMPLLIHYIVIPAFFIYYYLCYFKCFRRLMKTYPRFFSCGYMSQKGPSERTRNDTKFSFTLHGKGWGNGSDLKSKPSKSLTVKVSSTDPGYRTTAISIICAAITILTEKSNMPRGGVIMPGAAFYDTGIVDRLVNQGISYEVMEGTKKYESTYF